MVLNKNYNQTKWQLAPGSQKIEKNKKLHQNNYEHKSSSQNKEIIKIRKLL